MEYGDRGCGSRKASSMFLLQHGEIDQQDVYDFRHPIAVRMGL